MTKKGKRVSKIACYKPLIRAEKAGKWLKAKDGHYYQEPVVFSTDRLEEYDKNKLGGYFTNYTTIPCGNCVGCQLDHSREWADRTYLESLYYEHNYFVTLTYDVDHLVIPEEVTTSNGITYTKEEEWKGILVPQHFRQFTINLRQIMQRDYNFTGIRYIGCGEYGGEFSRPHYHLILLNCPLPPETFYNPRINWEKNTYWQNSIIERAWTKGISNITEATWDTMAYTARYITKKIKNNGRTQTKFKFDSEDIYAMQGQIPEFFRCSTQPGIGYIYYEDHKHEIYKHDQILVRTRKGPRWVSPPSYFDEKYKAEFPEEFEKIERKRQKSQLNNLILKGQQTSLTRWEQLQVEMATKEEQNMTLKRDLT